MTKIINGHEIKRGADLYGADLECANLEGADLTGSNLRRANLWGANLSSADLSGAFLYGADLRGANLWCANLAGADLRGADLRGANLIGAVLDGAHIDGAKFKGSNVHLSQLWHVVRTVTEDACSLEEKPQQPKETVMDQEITNLRASLQESVENIHQLAIEVPDKHRALIEDLYIGVQASLEELRTVEKVLCPPPMASEFRRILHIHRSFQRASSAKATKLSRFDCVTHTHVNGLGELRGVEPFDEILLRDIDLEDVAQVAEATLYLKRKPTKGPTP